MRLQRPAIWFPTIGFPTIGFLVGFGLAALVGGLLTSPGAGLSGKSDRRGEEPPARGMLAAKVLRA